MVRNQLVSFRLSKEETPYPNRRILLNKSSHIFLAFFQLSSLTVFHKSRHLKSSRAVFYRGRQQKSSRAGQQNIFFSDFGLISEKKITQKCNKILISSFFAVHEKRKQFECQVCSHQFARKHHLSKHILAVHAKVKPYGCQQCDQSFLQRHHLGAHIMSVHQPPIQEEADGTKVSFIYYVSTYIAQNLI